MFDFLQEVERIKNEHPDDSCAVMNDRVKGSLKVTRAFGAGFLKQVANLSPINDPLDVILYVNNVDFILLGVL